MLKNGNEMTATDNTTTVSEIVLLLRFVFYDCLWSWKKARGNPTDDWFVIAAVIENIEFKAIVLYPYKVTAFRPVAKISTGVACEQAPGLEERSKFPLSNSGTGSLFAGYHRWGGLDELHWWVGRQSADTTCAACLNSQSSPFLWRLHRLFSWLRWSKPQQNC